MNAPTIHVIPSVPYIDSLTGEVLDGDAVAIGDLYSRSNSSFVDAVQERFKCGLRLAEKKATLAHGELLSWLNINENILGFGERTAQMLMKASASNTKLASDLDERDAIKLSRQMWGHTKAFVEHNTGDNEWYTPADIIEAARSVLGGFDLDPASSALANETIGADLYYTAEDDGLSQDWPRSRIWMNPPYAQPLMGKFAAKYAEAIEAGSTGIVLVNNATETEWFQELALISAAICLYKSRVRFLDQNGEPGAPLQGQAIMYAGDEKRKFEDVFRGFGIVLVHA